MDLGFHLAMSYHYLKRPTSRKNFGDVVGQNHALILTQCLSPIKLKTKNLTKFLFLFTIYPNYVYLLSSNIFFHDNFWVNKYFCMSVPPCTPTVYGNGITWLRTVGCFPLGLVFLSLQGANTPSSAVTLSQ